MGGQALTRRSTVPRAYLGVLGALLTAVFSVGTVQPALAAGYSPDPVGNVGVEVRSSALAISWSPPASAGESSYFGTYGIKEYRVTASSDYSSSTYGNYGSCTTQTTACIITGLTNGASYTLEITATNTSYFTSKVTLGPFIPCCNAPRAPARVLAAAADGTVEASWEPATGPGIGPVINYTATTNPPGGTCTTTTQTCRFTGLNNGTSYVVSVVASNIGGSSATTSSNIVTPKGAAPPPTGVNAAVVKDAVVVSWTAPVSNGGAPLTQYLVTSDPPGGSCQAAGTALKCSVAGVEVGATYTFTVSAVNESGTSAPSAPSAPLLIMKSPGAAGQVTAQFSGTTATIKWTKPESSGGMPIVKYAVVASPGGKACTTKKLACVIRGLTPGVTYQFTVQALNALGAGTKESSQPVSAPLPPPKPTPTYG